MTNNAGRAALIHAKLPHGLEQRARGCVDARTCPLRPSRRQLFVQLLRRGEFEISSNPARRTRSRIRAARLKAPSRARARRSERAPLRGPRVVPIRRRSGEQSGGPDLNPRPSRRRGSAGAPWGPPCPPPARAPRGHSGCVQARCKGRLGTREPVGSAAGRREKLESCNHR
jgi:hypothetical protein